MNGRRRRVGKRRVIWSSGPLVQEVPTTSSLYGMAEVLPAFNASWQGLTRSQEPFWQSFVQTPHSNPASTTTSASNAVSREPVGLSRLLFDNYAQTIREQLNQPSHFYEMWWE